MAQQFDLCGDHLALDFANTASESVSAAPLERLPDYPALVRFARQTGIVGSTQARDLLAVAERDSAAAKRAHGRALVLRNALYRLLAAVARSEPARRCDIDVLEGQLWRLRIGDDLALGWRADESKLDSLLGPITHAAFTLATDPSSRGRVRLCEAPDCEWLFYDGSRNRSRRWCDMRQCGNRMKARRHYARHAPRSRSG